MRLLLDTHIILWAAFEPEKLPSNIHNAIADKNNIIFISMVSLWEISIKHAIGRLSIPEEFISNMHAHKGYNILQLSLSHINCHSRLPLIHRDPFDRILVAQAQAEKLTIATLDTEIGRYDVLVLQ